MRAVYVGALCSSLLMAAARAQGSAPAATPLVEGKRALAGKDFRRAKAIFEDYLRAHPAEVQAELGVADAELGLHEYESAELHYRQVVAAQPLLWAAHKNLVIIEAALHRWDDFDGERLLLRAARQRGDAGVSPHDIDVIDVITVRGQRWIVRDYFEPLGRTRTRYNFERFSADGRALAYVSLESADALRSAKAGDSVVVGSAPRTPPETNELALNWYNGKSHGTIARYTSEPEYEEVRATFLSWLKSHP